MARSDSELLKGVLEGVVLALIARQPAHGYEITASLREHGFSELAEGTIYALLLRLEQRGFVAVEKVRSEKGPPRKVYSLSPAGETRLQEFWQSWDVLVGHLQRLHPTDHDEEKHR